jgi:hypothetical protein
MTKPLSQMTLIYSRLKLFSTNEWVGVMSDFTVYKPRNGQILKKGRVMSASDLAVELTQLQATNERLTAERDGAVNLLEGLTNGSNSRKQIIHLLGNADCFLDQLRQQAKGKD